MQADLLRRREDGTWPELPEIVTEGGHALECLSFQAHSAALYRITRPASQPGA